VREERQEEERKEINKGQARDRKAKKTKD